jgi:hypothetical protein
VGFVVDKVALGKVFSEDFGFLCQFSFHRLLHTHPSSGAGTTGQLVAAVPSGLGLTHPKKLKILHCIDVHFIIQALCQGKTALEHTQQKVNDIKKKDCNSRQKIGWKHPTKKINKQKQRCA